MTRACGFLATALLLSTGSALAATPAAGAGPRRHVLSRTELRDLPRSANGRDYMLYVGLPASFAKEPARRYPVLYLCDGYWDFTLVNGFYGNLVYDRVVPEFVIVGIGYQGDAPDYDTLRRYDYTPAADPEKDPKGETSGHAAEFLSVLETQIVPFVEKEYRGDPTYRVLGGSSLGGLFALYAMYARPGLFQGVIAPSPATPWAHDWLFDFEGRFAAASKPLAGRLFMSGASEEWPDLLDGIKRFNTRLEKRPYAGLTYQWRLVDGERHAGTKAESYNRGVRFAFAPLAPKD